MKINDNGVSRMNLKRQLWSMQLYFMILVIFLVSHQMGYTAIGLDNESKDEILVRISYKTKAQEHKAKQFITQRLKLPIENEKPGQYIESRLTWDQVIYLRLQGFDVAIVFTIHLSNASPAYHNFMEIVSELDSLAVTYPLVMHLVDIGKSAALKNPIRAVKISDNAHTEEDEPAVLFIGVHHAREPLGAEICLYLIKYLCENYSKQPIVKQWIDESEIWFVPVLNPDGFQLALDPERKLSWWRKNCRDNNKNGRFDPDSDGVDLNRNYDFNWEQGGSSDVTSLYYRGSAPFSEPELQVLRDLAFQQNFIFAIDYHSFGESILYPWGNFQKPPELNLIVKIAEELALRIHKKSKNAFYDLIPLDARMGQSAVWFYAEMNVLSYIIENGDTYYPPEDKIKFICQENLKAFEYLLNRLHRARLTGHVRDTLTKEPLVADVRVQDFTAPYVKSRRSEPFFGRYDKILSPGTYTITFTAIGYLPKTVNDVIIHEDRATLLDIELREDTNYRPLGNY